MKVKEDILWVKEKQSSPFLAWGLWIETDVGEAKYT
jgi:hypothetical protein